MAKQEPGFGARGSVLVSPMFGSAAPGSMLSSLASMKPTVSNDPGGVHGDLDGTDRLFPDESGSASSSKQLDTMLSVRAAAGRAVRRPGTILSHLSSASRSSAESPSGTMDDSHNGSSQVSGR